MTSILIIAGLIGFGVLIRHLRDKRDKQVADRTRLDPPPLPNLEPGAEVEFRSPFGLLESYILTEIHSDGRSTSLSLVDKETFVRTHRIP